MKIHLVMEINRGRSGIEARSPELKLTSHGIDEIEAEKSLQKVLKAWGEGLKNMDVLTETLKRKQIKYEPNGQSLVIELEKKTN